jgi:F0F1-type ATP synthase membrane subunit b/b'
MYFFAAQVEHTAEHEEHHAATAGGGGPFSDNLFNWVVLVAIIIWMLSTKLPPVFNSRREAIEDALNTAKAAREEGTAFFEEQKSKVANVEKETATILQEAKQIAAQMQTQLEEQTEKDMTALFQKFESSIQNERQLLVNEMRNAAVKAAVLVAEEQLRHSVNEEVKKNLLNQFMSQLDTIAREGEDAPGKIESVKQASHNQ